MRIRFLAVGLLACLALTPRTFAQPATQAAPADTRLDWWREARFGLFVHFGLYAVPEGRWGDRDGYGEWLLSSAQIPLAEYEALAERFTVERFDAAEWARLAKGAGMQYVVVTTKHHDGFCLFDSAHTDWDVERTPFRRDMMRELSDAVRAEGLQIGWYHSIMDWHHPDYLPRRAWDPRPAADASMERYTVHLQKQVSELLTGYGPIGLMWFDGQWEATWNHERGQALYDLCRTLQPNVIVNNRVDVGFGQDGMTSDPRFAGDYGTPEQSVPTVPPLGVDWETCMTMNRHWGWNAADTEWKSARTLIHTLIDVVSKGGNLLLNVGPRPDGTFPPLAVERLREIGRWMDVNGEAIHGTERSQFRVSNGARLTQRVESDRTRLFVHLLGPQAVSSGVLRLGAIGNHIARAYPLGAPDMSLETTQDEIGGVEVTAQGLDLDPYATVIVLELEGAPLPYVAPVIASRTTTFIDTLEAVVTPPVPGLGVEVHFNGLTAASVHGPLRLTLSQSASLQASTLSAAGAPCASSYAEFKQVEPRPGTMGAPEPSVRGLRRDVYEGDFERVPDFDTEPVASELVTAVEVTPDLRREHVAARFTAWLWVERPEVALFALGSDDGSRLWIGDECVVDNDGFHGFKVARGEVALGPGWHRLQVGWFNGTGGADLSVELALGGQPLAPLRLDALAAQ
ncbi:MAG: alpha-L-fucosidase [Planctomycetota bacterium]